MINIIYDATLLDSLRDLKQTVDSVVKFYELMAQGGFETFSRTMTQQELDREGLKPGEIALGKWIVRPRKL